MTWLIPIYSYGLFKTVSYIIIEKREMYMIKTKTKRKHFKSVTLLFLSGIVMAGLFVGCNGSNTVEEEIIPFPVVVNSVTVDKAPKAVASLSEGLTDILVDIGCRAQIAGYTNGDTLPDIPAPLPVESDTGFRWFWEKEPEPVLPPEPVPTGEIGTSLEPDMEKIGEFKPEIIFTPLPLTRAQMEKLDAVSIKVVVLPSPKNTEQLMQNYLAMYRAMLGEKDAEEICRPLIAEAQKKLDYIISQIPAQKQTLLYVCDTAGAVATKDTYIGALLGLLAENVAGEATNYTLSEEELAALDPNLILHGESVPVEFFTQSKSYSEKKAAVEGKITTIPTELFSEQTLMMTESVRSLAKLIYPDVDFTEPVPEIQSSEATSK